jgi:hypothetical protein
MGFFLTKLKERLMKKAFFVLAILIVAVMVVFAETYRCQLDNGTMYFTGNTKTEWGKLAKEYKCPSGHSYWIVEQNSYNSPPPSYNSGPKCQYDNMNLIFTGETKTDWGKLLKKYQCPSGHEYWLAN